LFDVCILPTGTVSIFLQYFTYFIRGCRMIHSPRLPIVYSVLQNSNIAETSFTFKMSRGFKQTLKCINLFSLPQNWYCLS